jgi:hypothetical protein
MTSEDNGNIIYAYIATLHLKLFGKYRRAYSLLVRSPRTESWHWGVKSFEHQPADMEMFGLRRVLRALSDQDPDLTLKLHAYTRNDYLEPRLRMASKTKRDIERGIEKAPLWNHDAWMESTTLWDMYRGAMREAHPGAEKSFLHLADQRIRAEYIRISSPLQTHVPFLESPEELALR